MLPALPNLPSIGTLGVLGDTGAGIRHGVMLDDAESWRSFRYICSMLDEGESCIRSDQTTFHLFQLHQADQIF